MSRVAMQVAHLGGEKSMPWSLDDSSLAIDMEKYIPETRCRATKLYAWSRRLHSYLPGRKQDEHIPLAPIQAESTPCSSSDCSFCDTEDTECGYDAGLVDKTNISTEPLIFNMQFEDGTYTKQLDYSTFARWGNVETLLRALERESAAVMQLWDVREDMAICKGDWDARVRPGMEIDVSYGHWETDGGECGSSFSSDGEGDEKDEARAWDTVEVDGRRWWFGAWKRKVEQETAGGGVKMREPSCRTVVLGTLAMATFLGIVVLLCTV